MMVEGYSFYIAGRRPFQRYTRGRRTLLTTDTKSFIAALILFEVFRGFLMLNIIDNIIISL